MAAAPPPSYAYGLLVFWQILERSILNGKGEGDGGLWFFVVIFSGLFRECCTRLAAAINGIKGMLFYVSGSLGNGGKHRVVQTGVAIT